VLVLLVLETSPCILCGTQEENWNEKGWVADRQVYELNGWGLERNRADLRPGSKSLCRSFSYHPHFCWVSLPDPILSLLL
jgi:hypothetical protein